MHSPVAPRPPASKVLLKSRAFNVQLFLVSAGLGRWVAKLKTRETVFSQGDLGKYVMYLREGGVKLTVVNTAGKEAVVEILGPGDFFGVRCLAGRSVYTATATAIVPTTVLVIEKDEMIRVLHAEHEISDRFIASMLVRSARGEEALIDQLFNSSEKRLARVLLLLARYGEQGEPQKVLPKAIARNAGGDDWHNAVPNQFFHEQIQKLGFIEYGGKLRGLQVNKSLLGVVLQG